MVRFSIEDDGWTATIREEWPDFFPGQSRVLQQDGLQSGNAEANAMQIGVQMLRGVNIDSLATYSHIGLPIKVEQRLAPEQVRQWNFYVPLHLPIQDAGYCANSHS